MTIGVVWIRSFSRVQELLFATDSRVSGGKRFDSCPKIMPLPRGDVAIAFAGDTAFSYPMMLQMSNASQSYRPLRDRAMNITKFCGHVVRILDQMQSSIHTYSEGEEIPRLTLHLGGHDWIDQKLKYWRIEWSNRDRCFRAHSPVRLYRRRATFFGDKEWIAEGKLRLKAILQKKYGRDMPGDTLDMEPFAVIRDLLREATPTHSIGGPPQLVKVYQHANCQPVGVFWPNRAEGEVTMLGRRFLAYENTDSWIIDPDSFMTEDGSLLRGHADEGSRMEVDSTDSA